MKKIVIILSIVVISGCASLSQSQCQSGDWYGIGLTDGSVGAPLSTLEQHRNSCGEYAIRIDGEAWRAGRDEGLKQYCRPSNGYQLGRYGNSFNNVCPNNLSDEFNRAFSYGNKIHLLGLTIADMERKKIEVEEAILDESLSREDRRHHLEDLKQLEVDIERSFAEIDAMERRNPYNR